MLLNSGWWVRFGIGGHAGLNLQRLGPEGPQITLLFRGLKPSAPSVIFNWLP
jgi:hypothetical protein